ARRPDATRREGLARASDRRRTRRTRRPARVGPSRMRGVRRLPLATLALTAACSGDGRTVLTIYSPHGKDLLEYYEKGVESTHPTIDVQWVDMGSQEVLA